VNTHVDDTNNPHGVTKSQVGLSNVDNTSDLDKPISTATQMALDKIPFNPMTMLAQGDNEFTCMASIIARPSGTGVNNDPIIWSIISDGDHDYGFMRSLIATTSGNLQVKYPEVKKILFGSASPDETIVVHGAQFGCSISKTACSVTSYRQIMQGFRLVGNGTNTWTKSGTFSGNATVANIDVTGLTLITPLISTNPVEGTGVSVDYVGKNNYRIERNLAGGQTSFYLIDNATNTRVTTNPTSNDGVIVSNYGIMSYIVNLEKWKIGAVGNQFLNSAVANIWIQGCFELWMKVFTISTTELLAKWQSKSGVTSYTLKRSTAYTVDVNGNYVLTSPTTVYTGTDLQYLDSGLTTNTMYYYQLLDQSGIEITQFNTKTK